MILLEFFTVYVICQEPEKDFLGISPAISTYVIMPWIPIGVAKGWLGWSKPI